LKLCECGCGTKLPPRTYERKSRKGSITFQPRFAVGHARKGKPFSAEHAANHKAAIQNSIVFQEARVREGIKQRNRKRPATQGANHYRWKGGQLRRGKGLASRHNIWAAQVKRRDAHCCQDCGTTDKVEAHHIFPYADYPAERENIHNGITLCESCHDRVHRCLRIMEAQKQPLAA
jgi:5-methylcytosine-specific restriction endonuclease McrA